MDNNNMKIIKHILILCKQLTQVPVCRRGFPHLQGSCQYAEGLR